MNSKQRIMQMILATGFMVASGYSQAVQYVAADQTLGTRLCMKAITASPLQLHSMSKHHQLAVRQVTNQLSCNDLPVAQFAYQVGNHPLHQYLKQFSRGQVKIKDLGSIASLPEGTVLVRAN